MTEYLLDAGITGEEADDIIKEYRRSDYNASLEIRYVIHYTKPEVLHVLEALEAGEEADGLT